MKALKHRLGRIRLDVAKDGFTVRELTDALCGFDKLGGAWSMTMTVRTGGVLEAHLLQVRLEVPVQARPGFRKLSKKELEPRPVLTQKIVFFCKPVDLVPELRKSLLIEKMKKEKESNEDGEKKVIPFPVQPGAVNK